MTDSKSVLWVTSFAKDMWDASGHLLLKSFLKYKIEGDLSIMYEDFDFPMELKKSKILNENQTNCLKLNELKTESPILIKWLKENEKVIPDFLGGLATKEKNPDIFKEVHKRKASRFFRKVAALDLALKLYGQNYDWIFWIDCDCQFKAKFKNNLVFNWFDSNVEVFYHMGPKRRSFKPDICFETGIIGFRKDRGYDVIRQVVNYFMTQRYLKHHRWDDGYIFRVIIEKNMSLKSRSLITVDLVNPKKQKNYDAIPFSPFGKFIVHDKGVHGRTKISI